ncbi:conserved Plasmodium protein, unknown function [Plasmodium gallinaceum]|uniref:Uncharacterized protein n=1 Tax=Plasmodium gallinaceum TaxID=5849 RepID=A0A1J1GKW3_PLAGA|nr:conserved Plasmodium protein, unknown function [Plasmodium gallinaceum]CRG93022.1 conserved Plasmodium protein, unknown function [Plasmodium gallinaceum]
MALINFKEKIQILLKLKESLIPQVDGNFIKNWEMEAIKYQSTSENILVELKNINFIEGLVSAISSQLSYLRINLQNYQNMSEQEKDKFKRLYVLAALGLIAKLKLILFFSTYINSREHKKFKNFPNINENNYELQQNNCGNSYDNEIDLSINNSEDYMNGKSTKKNSLLNNLNDYYSQFHNFTDNYKENIFNAMILNNIVNYNSQDNSGKNLNNSNFNEKSFNVYNNNNNNNNNYNSHFTNNLEDLSLAMMNNFSLQKNDNLQNSSILTSKKRSLPSPQNQNKTVSFLKNSQTLNNIENNQEEHMLNYNNQINNESQKFFHQNQEQISKYLTNINQNIHSTNNENSELDNCNSNLNSYYQFHNDNGQSKNVLRSYNNKVYGINDNIYKNSYYL